MKPKTYEYLAWSVLGWNLLVILWGAFVRATGSGAGCGSHWPDCNGEVLPRPENIETMIEFTHRLTSGVALLAVLALVVFAFRTFPKGHLARSGAVGSLIFILIEALLGAGLVIFEYVAGDTRPARGAVVALHLVNTLILLGWLTLTAWGARGGSRPRLQGSGAVGWGVVVSLVLLCLLGASGAITALGDTLFPVESLREGIAQDLSPGAHILIRLRVIHPILAIFTAAWVVFAAMFTAIQRPSTKRSAIVLVALIAGQIGVGLVNLALLAPVPLQLVHLLMADGVWLALVWMAAGALAAPSAVRAA